MMGASPALPPAQIIRRTADLRRAVDRLRACSLLAVDTESNSLYAYRERVCLIQVSTRRADYLIDPLALDDMSALSPLMADPAVEKVFHAVYWDYSKEFLNIQGRVCLKYAIFWGLLSVFLLYVLDVINLVLILSIPVIPGVIALGPDDNPAAPRTGQGQDVQEASPVGLAAVLLQANDGPVAVCDLDQPAGGPGVKTQLVLDRECLFDCHTKANTIPRAAADP